MPEQQGRRAQLSKPLLPRQVGDLGVNTSDWRISFRSVFPFCYLPHEKDE
jgi:hypothetical protein